MDEKYLGFLLSILVFLGKLFLMIKHDVPNT